MIIDDYYFTDNKGDIIPYDALLNITPFWLEIIELDTEEPFAFTIEEFLEWLDKSPYDYLERSYDFDIDVDDQFDGEYCSIKPTRTKFLNYQSLKDHLDKGVIAEFLKEKTK